MRKLIFTLLLPFAFANNQQATAQDMPKAYSQLIKDIEPKVISWRRHFHENPELSNREFNTGKYIAE